LYPFFDNDCNVLYTAGKGDGNIRYYELADGHLYGLNQHSSTTPQKGIGFLPKRCLNVYKNELMRCLKLTNNTLEFVSFDAMRKTEGFQEDLYPPCISGEPSLKAEEWLDGRNAEPKRRSMNPELSEKHVNKGATISINTNISSELNLQASPDLKQAEKIKSMEYDLTAALEKIQNLQKENSQLKVKNNELVNEVERKNIDIAYLRDDLHQLKRQISKGETLNQNKEETHDQNEELSEY